jgi:acylphosphatase
MKAAHIFISGFVQGVGFRYFVKKNAVDLGLKGWVRNTSDGKVEAVLQGRKEDIEKMIRLCRKGPFLAEVKNVEVVWDESVEDFEDFNLA